MPSRSERAHVLWPSDHDGVLAGIEILQPVTQREGGRR
jgi:hypothetical protein